VRSFQFLSALAFSVVACAHGSAPSPSAWSASAPALAAPLSADDGGGTDASDVDEPAARFRACSKDEDCVAVDRVGCCHNGWKAAVAVSRADAYASSFACPELHPMCAMYIVRDARVARCSERTHLCTMVEPARDKP